MTSKALHKGKIQYDPNKSYFFLKFVWCCQIGLVLEQSSSNPLKNNQPPVQKTPTILCLNFLFKVIRSSSLQHVVKRESREEPNRASFDECKTFWSNHCISFSAIKNFWLCVIDRQDGVFPEPIREKRPKWVRADTGSSLKSKLFHTEPGALNQIFSQSFSITWNAFHWIWHF